MKPHEGGACQADTRQTPVTHQGTPDQRSPRRLYDTPTTALSPASRTNSRRWQRKPRRTTILSEAIVWATFTIITAAVLLAGCMLLALIWPATP